MNCLVSRISRYTLVASLAIIAFLLPTISANAQSEVTGAISGRVVESRNPKNGLGGIQVTFTDLVTGNKFVRKTDKDGNYALNSVNPSTYRIEITSTGYKKPPEKRVTVPTVATRAIVPDFTLEPETVASATPTPDATTPPTTSDQPKPIVTPSPTNTVTGTATDATTNTDETQDIRGDINTRNAAREGDYSKEEVSTLPLGAITLTRTFDELALLLPGVAPPPQTLGNGSGPGIGAGVGSAGQFAVNGLRSRGNNFTVDGSDDNDEDIGVRRQGFLALVPQPVESIQDFHVITLLAPAQYGRNFGAQVNAVSKSGGNETHGTFFGLFNSSQLNAPDFFDTTSGNTSIPLQARLPDSSFREVRLNGSPLPVTNNAGKQDSFTLGQGGFAFGGPLVPLNQTTGRSFFYFFSAEGQLLHAVKESNFAVPTVEQRGIIGSGATGIVSGGQSFFPTVSQGDAVFSLFPFPNNPTGVYGRNTFTKALPAKGRGKIFSGKGDATFNLFGRQQQLTGRYNFTDDARDIPVTGGALFSTLRPNVRTQDFSTFLNGDLTGPDTRHPISNQLRASYGRTNLRFDERPDRDFLLPSNILTGDNARFLLNAPFVENDTRPGLNFVNYRTVAVNNVVGGGNRAVTELGGGGRGSISFGALGPIGQVVIAGFSPVGVDVFNFPQARVNNTYQLADTASTRLGNHNITFGEDTRRIELNSSLPRNSRALLTFNGSPLFLNNQFQGFLDPASLAAAGAPSGFSQVQYRGGLVDANATIGLRYYELNFFGQDEWRVRPNLSISYGLRYELNTTPHEDQNRIEQSFSSADLNLIPGLRKFIGARTEIFNADKNNFAPRIGIAYSPSLFGNRTTVFRVGYGIFYDQTIGAVISQSRNVFPSFLTLDTSGGIPNFAGLGAFNIFNPSLNLFGRGGFGNGLCFSRNSDGDCVDFRPYIVSGTLNQSNPNIPLSSLVNSFGGNAFPGGGFGLTLPAQKLNTPMAQQYSFTFEQQLSSNLVVSAAYVGTQGTYLLRLTTPNLGPNAVLLTQGVTVSNGQIFLTGTSVAPGSRLTSSGTVIPGSGRPSGVGSGVGAVNIYESSANSRYDALQVQARGRFFRSMQFQAQYTFSRANDDASDVFDLAGSSALPQNSLTRAGERADSNFDARHRFSYNVSYELPKFSDRSRVMQFLLGGLGIASIGQFQTDSRSPSIVLTT